MTRPSPSTAPRGACPTLAEPMPVADGLLARFRPVSGFSPAQVAALAEAALGYGNGLIEVTARGSVQVRGLSPESEEGFRVALDVAGIAARTGVSIEYSPIAGDDPREIRDPRPLARMLGHVCATALSRGTLSPKLSIVIESGGQVPLGGLKADIRLLARPEGWALALGERVLGVVAETGAPSAVAALLDMLQAAGPRARAGDLDAAEAAGRIENLTAGGAVSIPSATGALGRLDLAVPALRVGVPFGQVDAPQMLELARIMGERGIAEARPAPDRTLVLIGATADGVEEAGWWFAPGSGPSLCSGAERGERGIVQAAGVARAFAQAAPELCDGSFHLHVSTCAKGCAYAGRAGIVLDGEGLRLYRAASQKPFARLDPAAIEASIVHLAERIRDMRRSGETVLDTLGRLEQA